MSPSGRTEHVTLLRAAIARIEAKALGPGMGTSCSGADWPEPTRDSMPSQGCIPLGPDGFSLDAVLGGGLRRGALHEVAPATPRDEAAASGFALALAARCLAARPGILIWIVDDCAGQESGTPYRPGLAAHGLDPDRLILVRTHGAASTLWAAEEALRTGDFVVLAELWGGRDYGLAPSRRLLLAAREHGALGLLLHAGLPTGTTLSSGSETRFRVGAHPSPRRAQFGRRLPVPGEAAFAVTLDKVRAAGRAFDRHQVIPLLWNAEQRCFHDHDLSVALASPSAHRPGEGAGPRPGRDRRRTG